MNFDLTSFLWFLFVLSIFVSGIAYLNWYMTKRIEEEHGKKSN